MAKISTPAVSTRAYRHFAVATLVVTLLVGIFASGENRQAVAEEFQNQKLAAQRAQFAKHKYGTAKLVQTEPAARVYNSNADYADTLGGYGEATDRYGSREHDSANFRGAINRGGGSYVPASYAKRQISEEELAALTPAQRAALLAQIANGGLSTDQTERQRQINSLVAASQRRSGSEAGVE
jgi:hypothetical protein